MNSTENQYGFTLIEALIYIALFAILIGGTVIGAYQIMESTRKTAAKVQIQEEANFLLRKVEWVLNGTDTINSPASDSSGSTLSVDKLGSADNPYVLDLDGTNLRLKRGAGTATVLNSSLVEISDLEIVRSGAGSAEELVINFEIDEEPFTITKTIR